MQQTQINIYNERKQFRYGIEYVDNIECYSGDGFCYFDRSDLDGDCFQILCDSSSSVIRQTNKWSKDRIESDCGFDYTVDTQTDYIPPLIDISSIDLFFPNCGVETYTGNWLYVFSAYTFINGDKIILCEKLIDRRDSIAYDKGKKEMHNIRYSEYINIQFPDPWNITYSEEWADFRQNVCGEPENINNTGSLLIIEIHPVKLSETGDYIKLDNYLGGMNSLLLSDTKNISLYTLIDWQSPRTVNLSFIYNTDLYTNGLEEYIQETYKLGDFDMNIEMNSKLILFDNNNVYNIYDPESGDGTVFDLTPQDLATIDFNLSGDGWDSFHDGLELKAITELVCDGLPLLTLISNILCVTKDMFASILANTEPYTPEELLQVFDLDTNTNNFNAPGMETINIVNKTEKKVISIDKPNDFKNNLTRPVFIRAQKNDGMIIHPGVTENISLNLRSYKNHVESFTLRIAGVDFIEYGRQGSNVIFKVIGKQLPEELEAGTYYVLDDNFELVTSGPYTLE